MKWKKNLLLLFFLLAGIIVGSLLASLTAGIPWLSWLSYGKSVGISTQSPLYLDFSVLQLAFGLEIGVNVAQIICIIAAIFLYKATMRRL